MNQIYSNKQKSFQYLINEFKVNKKFNKNKYNYFNQNKTIK